MKKYSSKLKLIIKIQTIIRGKFARIIVRRLKEPFQRMTYQELSLALKEIEIQIESSFVNKNFQLCEELQGMI